MRYKLLKVGSGVLLLGCVIAGYMYELHSPMRLMNLAIAYDRPDAVRFVARTWPHTLTTPGPVYPIPGMWRDLPINQAASFGHVKAAEALLQSGASVQQNQDGFTPFFSVLSWERTDSQRRTDLPMLELLIKYDPQVITTAVPGGEQVIFSPLLRALTDFPPTDAFDPLMKKMVQLARDQGLFLGKYPMITSNLLDPGGYDRVRDRWVRMLLCSVSPSDVEATTRASIQLQLPRYLASPRRDPGTAEVLRQCGWIPEALPQTVPTVP